MSSDYISYLVSVSNAILYYPILIGLPIGIVCNLFSIFIYTRPNLNKKANTGFLFAFLCLLNICFMLGFVLFNRSKNLFGFTFYLSCGINSYIFRMAFCLVPWMQVIISFDRFISVVFPLKKQIMSKKWVLSCIMIGAFLLLAAANVPSLLPYTDSRGNCITTNDIETARNIQTILFRVYIPFALMLVMDVIVFKRLRESKRRVAVTTTQMMGQQNQISNREYNFMISTIYIDLSFVVFYTPAAVHLSITIVDLFVDWDTLMSTVINLLYNCSILTAFLYSVQTFFMFFILNRYFRNEVISILRLNKLFSKFNQTSTIGNGSANDMNRNMN